MYDEDDEIEADMLGDEDDEWCVMSDAHQATLRSWLADKSKWAKMRSLGKGFESGAKFVPSAPDGNCMFHSISTYITANKNNPEGNPNLHD